MDAQSAISDQPSPYPAPRPPPSQTRISASLEAHEVDSDDMLASPPRETYQWYFQ